MAELTQPGSFSIPEEKPKLPGGINVLTILTYIGCAVGLCWTFGGFAFMSWSLKMMDKAQNDGGTTLTDKQISDMEKGKVLIEKFMANKWPLILISLVGIGLCFYGALSMRKLKKDGFYIYTLGELMPVIATTLLLGFSTQFSNGSSYVIGLGIPILFVILYAGNLKHLK